MREKRFPLICAVCVVALLTSGCGTFYMRTYCDEPSPYCGVVFDAKAVPYSLEQIPKANYHPAGIWYYTFAAGFVLADMPLSFAFDTVLIPFDIYAILIGDDDEEATSNNSLVPNDAGAP